MYQLQDIYYYTCTHAASPILPVVKNIQCHIYLEVRICIVQFEIIFVYISDISDILQCFVVVECIILANMHVGQSITSYTISFACQTKHNMVNWPFFVVYSLNFECE